MNRAALIFVGVFLTFGSAWLGLVFFPALQMSPERLPPQVDELTGMTYPRPRSGEEEYGMRVYVAEGCVYCHSQQVRGGDYNADLERGWGIRRSHPRDYIYDTPELLGTMRTGPDLANIGLRQPSREWHFEHLYNPQITSPGSNMPPFRYLFEERPIVGQRSVWALDLPEEFAPPDGYEIVPTREARALVEYLRSRNQDYEIID